MTRLEPAVAVRLRRRERRLEYATLAWNVVGSVVVLAAAVSAHSVALAGFGPDSLIEIVASLVVVWQLQELHAVDHERRALRIIGVAFLLLAAYIAAQSAFVLLTGTHPHRSLLGLGRLPLTAAAMFGLAAGKRATGRSLGNRVITTEARVTLIDGLLAVAVLAGLLLNAVAGLWWADPAAAFVIVYYGAREGRHALREATVAARRLRLDAQQAGDLGRERGGERRLREAAPPRQRQLADVDEPLDAGGAQALDELVRCPPLVPIVNRRTAIRCLSWRLQSCAPTHINGMTRLRALSTLFAALGGLVFAAPALANANVNITRTGFQPAAVTIKAGESVNWVNQDDVFHQLSSPPAKLQSPQLEPTNNFGFTFTTPGTFTVVDPQKNAFSMTVTVQPTALVTVHLGVSPKAVAVGGTANLAGTISTGLAGQQVTVAVQPCGSSTFSAVKTVTTAAGGAFSLTVKPDTTSTFRVRFGEGQATVGVQVRPRLVLTKTGTNRYAATLTGAKGKILAVQMKAAGSGWKAAGRARLRGAHASFVLKTAPGTRVRVSVDSKAAGTCLATAVSNAVTA